ncbi:MAG: alpha-galactosidase [Opitutaceae bacterium]|nr:alpha-galactosidase [Opitutaceae bacterium]
MNFSTQLENASAEFDGRELVVSTGLIRRVWRVVPNGLSTVSFKREEMGADEWVTENECKCDWYLAGLVERGTKAEIVSAHCEVIKEDPYTADRLNVEILLQYPESYIELRYRVWVYPDSPGVRTQLSMRALSARDPDKWPSYLTASYAERIGLQASGCERLAVGYYNDTQHRGSFETPMMKEERRVDLIVRREVHDWANILYLRRDTEGMALVKESHKCVNQEGVDTGAFILNPDEVKVTGLGLRINGYGDDSEWIRHDRFHEMWANWSILFSGDEREGSRAVKAFDRYRYPFDPKRDIYIMANTWGSRGSGELSRSAAEEENIVREIESCADLGIDVLQIDDGWELDPGVADVEGSDWRPVKSRFPHGWERVKEVAKAKGVILGIWHAWTAPVERIMENFDKGDFCYFKIDFIGIDFRYQLEALMKKARALAEHAKHTIRINWDLTEIAARVGYFYGREFGQLFPRNSQAPLPGNSRIDHVLYRPSIFLRDAWEYAHHMNLNHFLINIQNKDRFERSGADRYSHSYCFAVAMMAVPNFMQETHFYSQAARDELRPLIALYKEHREGILGGFVFPIGEEPSDASWSGFQCILSNEREGYLTIFREIDNAEGTCGMTLDLPSGEELILHDLVRDETLRLSLSNGNTLQIAISKPGDFRFYRYEVS